MVWDAEQVYPLTHTHTTHQMPGQKYKGVWRSIGKEGVFDFTEYEDVGLSEQVEEHGFDHEAFGEKAFERKKEALHTAMQAQTRARDASAVKGSEASIESMMALVQQLQIWLVSFFGFQGQAFGNNRRPFHFASESRRRRQHQQ